MSEWLCVPESHDFAVQTRRVWCPLCKRDHRQSSLGARTGMKARRRLEISIQTEMLAEFWRPHANRESALSAII